MPTKSTRKRDEESDTELVESMVLGVTSEGECVYIHNFESDIYALEFLESLTAGLRCDVLSSLTRRFSN